MDLGLMRVKQLEITWHPSMRQVRVFSTSVVLGREKNLSQVYYWYRTSNDYLYEETERGGCGRGRCTAGRGGHRRMADTSGRYIYRQGGRMAMAGTASYTTAVTVTPGRVCFCWVMTVTNISR
jgi:hypothetical protein